MKNYITELIGTFFLVLIIGVSGNPFAIGFGLTVLVYMGAHISGAHYNPVVTLAMLLRKEIDLIKSIYYIISQTLGATFAALVVFFLSSNPMEIQPNLSSSIYQILACEIIFTYLLVYVILNVATHPNLKGNSFYGLAIGLTVMVGAFTVGQTSGGVFNPAVSLGPTLSHFIIEDGISKHYLWYYLLGPIIGSLLATFQFNYFVKK
ncbi:MAG: MIP/aquaporin family protein [Flavobacteriaceae bacterium]